MQTKLGMRPALAVRQRRSLEVLRMDGAALTDLLEAEAARNPWLILNRAGLPEGSAIEPVAPVQGLHGHVLDWIARHITTPQERGVALALADALDPTGWLGEPLPEIARRTGLPLVQVQAVLRRVQQIEPAGLFARDLAECLTLQARAAEMLDAAMQAVLARLELLSRRGAAAVARAAGLPGDAVAQAAARLRGFDPKPGLRFGPAPVAVPPRRAPDLRAARDAAGRWSAALHEGAVPQPMLRAGAAGGPQARRAAELVELVARRNRTLLVVADAILAVQGAALDKGRGALRPLTRATVAEATGLSPSTVGRALNGVRIATPGGVWALADFFPAALGPDASSAGAEAALRRLIAAEDRAAPLSDAALARLLAAEGLSVSRRTVAKYRLRLGLAPAHLRKA
ncbi:MAG: hypothetical protein ACK4S2_12270 [Gemmobacter sp.]|uniref:RNA polymerase factor sigma-54 n=1 Tax=Gemmobacter sp. TaxID=1898957 RepID=UPI0039198B7A